MPALEVKNFFGFSDEEIKNLLEYARNNAFLIWEIARENEKAGENFAAISINGTNILKTDCKLFQN